MIRYDCRPHGPAKNKKGVWVFWEDAKALEAEVKRYRDALKRLRNLLAEPCIVELIEKALGGED